MVFAQTNPVITKWLQNTTITGNYYVSGNSTAISNGILVNCQEISYSTLWSYVKTKGIPAYKVGPYLDGNPNQAGNQNAIFKKYAKETLPLFSYLPQHGLGLCAVPSSICLAWKIGYFETAISSKS